MFTKTAVLCSCNIENIAFFNEDLYWARIYQMLFLNIKFISSFIYQYILLEALY